MPDRSKVYAERTFECDIHTLFKWLTKPEMIAQWFGPKDFTTGTVENELKVGGSYRIELKKEERVLLTVLGEYTEIRVPELIKFTYGYLDLENPPPASTITFSLTAIDRGHTELSMVQEFEVETPDFTKRSKAWNFMFERLAGVI